MGGEVRGGGGEVFKAAALVEGADEIAGNPAVAGNGHVRPLRVLVEIAGEPAFAECRARVLVRERLGAAGFEKDRVELLQEAMRLGNVHPSPDGDGGANVNVVLGHHLSRPRRRLCATRCPTQKGRSKLRPRR